MVKKKRARTHTDLVSKAKKNFDYDFQDPIQRDIKMVPWRAQASYGFINPLV